MSENSHDYQVTNDVPQENVSIENVSNAIDEKLIEQQKNQHLNANDIEAEINTEEENNEPQQEEKSEEDKKWDSRFTALSKKEKDLRQREQQIEQKILDFEARMEELQAPKEPEVEEVKKLPLEYRLKRNPLEALESIGMTYEQITEMVLNDGKMTPEMQMRLMKEDIQTDYKTKFEELENKLLEKERQEEEANYNQTITQFKEDINNVINSSEEYDLIQANEAYDLVYDVIEQYYQENGRILDTNEAADQVEQYLEEEIRSLTEKSKKIKSFRSTPTSEVVEKPRQSPTLSNSQAVSGVSNESGKLLSREESIAALANQIKWND